MSSSFDVITSSQDNLFAPGSNYHFQLTMSYDIISNDSGSKLRIYINGIASYCKHTYDFSIPVTITLYKSTINGTFPGSGSSYFSGWLPTSGAPNSKNGYYYFSYIFPGYNNYVDVPLDNGPMRDISFTFKAYKQLIANVSTGGTATANIDYSVNLKDVITGTDKNGSPFVIDTLGYTKNNLLVQARITNNQPDYYVSQWAWQLDGEDNNSSYTYGNISTSKNYTNINADAVCTLKVASLRQFNNLWYPACTGEGDWIQQKYDFCSPILVKSVTDQTVANKYTPDYAAFIDNNHCSFSLAIIENPAYVDEIKKLHPNITYMARVKYLDAGTYSPWFDTTYYNGAYYANMAVTSNTEGDYYIQVCKKDIASNTLISKEVKIHIDSRVPAMNGGKLVYDNDNNKLTATFEFIIPTLELDKTVFCEYKLYKIENNSYVDISNGTKFTANANNNKITVDIEPTELTSGTTYVLKVLARRGTENTKAYLRNLTAYLEISSGTINISGTYINTLYGNTYVQPYVYNGSKWVQVQPCIYNGSQWIEL